MGQVTGIKPGAKYVLIALVVAIGVLIAYKYTSKNPGQETVVNKADSSAVVTDSVLVETGGKVKEIPAPKVGAQNIPDNTVDATKPTVKPKAKAVKPKVTPAPPKKKKEERENLDLQNI